MKHEVKKYSKLTPNLLALSVSLAIFSGHAQAAITEFSQTGTTGTFQTGGPTIGSNLSFLNGTGNSYNYNSQFFTPASSGTYTFGTSSAAFDTVLIFYTGAFNSANPSANAVAINDDSSGAQSRRGLVNAGNCGGSTNNCSQLTANLVAGTNYYLVTTTYRAGTSITGTVWYYVDGVGIVGVGGNPATPDTPVAPPPPPPRATVTNSSQAMSNNPALGAARIIDANTNLNNLFIGFAGNNQATSNAATQTLPLLTGASQVAAGATLGGINRIVQARIENNRGMSSGDDFQGDKNVWMKSFGSWANQGDRDGVAGYKANTYGAVIGADFAVSSAIRLGGAFAYANSNVNGNSTIAVQSAKSDIYQLIGYGSYSLDERTEINFQADIGHNANKGQRTIAFTSTVASSSYGSDTAHVGLGLGRDYALSSQTTLTPSVRVDYTWIKDQSYSETGAGLLNLNVTGRTTQAFVIGTDLKLAHQFNDQFTLLTNLGAGYDTLNSQNSITAAFAGAADAAFVTYGIKPSPWMGRAGVGAVYETKNGMKITARYDTEYRQSFLNQTASLKARWSF